MKTTRKVLLAGTALAIAAIGNPALAQVGNITPGTVVQGANNGDDLCIDGTTQDGYTVNHALTDSEHGDSDLNDFDPDYSDSTACVSYEATQDFAVNNGPALTIAEVDSTGEDDLLIVEENGTGNATGNVSVEVTSHVDVTDPNNPIFLGLTQTSQPYGTFVAADYSYDSTVETLQDTLYEAETSVSGTGTTGTGSQSEYLVTTGNIWMEETTGTSSFDPGTGDVFYTPTDGTTTQLDINGLHMSTLTGGNTETISYGVDGISNGTSYVDVNPDSVVIHGGTTSTTVTVDNAGVLVQDSTNGTTFQVTNTGNVYVAGQIQIDGNAWVDGTLDVDGNAQFDSNVFVDGNVDIDSNLNVDGNTTLGGTLAVTGNISSTNGNLNLTNGNIVLTNGNVSAVTGNFSTAVNTPTLQNGTANAGAGVTVQDSLTVIGNTSVTGTFAVTGNATVSGTFSAGNTTLANATVTGNATVGGTFGVTGNTTLGNLSVGGVSSFAGNVVIGDGIAAIASAAEVTRATVNQAALTTGITIDATTQRISGLANGTVSATSSEAITGAQLFATNTRVGVLETGLANLTTTVNNLSTTVSQNFITLSDRANKAYQGVAMGFAMNAAPLNLANGEGGISGGVGYFQGEWGGAVKAQYVTDAGVGVGINVGFSEDAVGGGVGASIKF